MSKHAFFRVAAITLLLPTARAAAQESPDPFLWLEEVEGKQALEWVEKQNTAIKAKFAGTPLFKKIYDETLALLHAKDRIVFGRQHGDYIYNTWRDAKNQRGLYRRATVASYLAGKPEWTVLLDVDELAKQENKSWVFKGMTLRYPDYKRAIVRLSDGGSDAVVIREFDLESKTFVKGGFQLPEAKGSLDWIDEDTVYVDTNFGEGSLTTSGYPRIVKVWRRGTPLSEAKTLYEGKETSVSVGASREHFEDRVLDWVYDGTSFYTAKMFLRDKHGLVKLDIPDTARIHTYFDKLLFIEMKKEWKVGEVTYPQGAVLTIPLNDLIAGKKNFSVFFQPTERVSLASLDRTKSFVMVQVMEDVRDRLFRYQRKDGAWIRTEVEMEGSGTLRASSLHHTRDTFFLTYRSLLRPTTLYSVDAATLTKTVVQQAPERFDGSRFESAQHFATSKDGTKVPYFIVTPKGMKLDGRNKTLLYAYGGFRISQKPYYLAGIGKPWLERGGVYVIANIRGGGEYGPRWHAAALQKNRHKSFEDFEAVAEDLIARKITSPGFLGIRGGSNGGLLVGAAFTRRPDLYKAVVCQVPLLDMRRYNKLLAGASWMAEYGNPDVPEEWAFLKTYSPYHNLSKEKTYPRVLIMTSTKDDRVHPGHARKMVARMSKMGHPVFYYENTEGGHAGAANSKQRAFGAALVYTYLHNELGETPE
jgi:prolyl oligopeptidase